MKIVVLCKVNCNLGRVQYQHVWYTDNVYITACLLSTNYRTKCLSNQVQKLCQNKYSCFNSLIKMLIPHCAHN